MISINGLSGVESKLIGVNEALSIIKREHRNLGAVLSCLKGITRDLEHGAKNPDFRIFHGLLTYLSTFLHEFHHPKEDAHLFPALRRRCPHAAGILDELEEQHHHGESLLDDLRKALSIYEFQGAIGFGVFRDAVNTYVTFEQDHAWREEREVFPLAREYLSDEDWKRVHTAFSANEDPLFGETRKKEFETLHSAIVNLTPAPYGLGPSWD